MLYAISETTDRRSGYHFNEEDLLAELDGISVPGEFWDVYNSDHGNSIAYYYTPRQEDSTMIGMKYYDAAVQLMDDDLREEIAAEGNCETEEQFLREYERRHYEKYGEEFTI